MFSVCSGKVCRDSGQIAQAVEPVKFFDVFARELHGLRRWYCFARMKPQDTRTPPLDSHEFFLQTMGFVGIESIGENPDPSGSA